MKPPLTDERRRAQGTPRTASQRAPSANRRSINLIWIAAGKSVRGIWNAVVHARKHTESDGEIARKGRHIKEPAAIANVRLALGMFMGSTTIVTLMHDAIRMDVRASPMILSTGRPDLIDHAVNRPRRVDEGQGGTWRHGPKGIKKRDRDRDFDAKWSGKTCQHRQRK
jgi:hypothetical protein